MTDSNARGIVPPSGWAEINLISLRSFDHHSGVLSVVESEIDVPFVTRRIYYLHGLSPDSARGGHAHVNLVQFMVAIAGSFTVELERKGVRREFQLNSPREGILIPPLTWRELHHFSDDAVCLVLASDLYMEDDYIRDYEEFSKISSPQEETS